MSLGKVYLASGWFSPEWLEEVENIKNVFDLFIGFIIIFFIFKET